MRGQPPVLPGSVIIRHRIRFLRSCVISSFVILHREHSLRHRFKQAPCQNRRYSLCRIRHIFPSRFVTMPQGSPPREGPFSLHRRQRPPLPCSPCRMTDFRRCFPAIFLHFSQELLSPPAHRRSAGRLSPFRQFLLSPPLFFGNSVLLLPDLCVYFAQSIQRKRRDKPAALSLRSSSDGYPSQR